MGGNLPQVETYFGNVIGTRVLSSYYWIGLERDRRASNSLYSWVDGTQIGNGYVSNDDPYAHFCYNYQDVVGSYPTWNCSLAHVSFAYDMYTGDDGNYAQQQNSAYYLKQTGVNK